MRGTGRETFALHCTSAVRPPCPAQPTQPPHAPTFVHLQIAIHLASVASLELRQHLALRLAAGRALLDRVQGRESPAARAVHVANLVALRAQEHRAKAREFSNVSVRPCSANRRVTGWARGHRASGCAPEPPKLTVLQHCPGRSSAP